MPKIDSVTGCEVMTVNEFWIEEAKHEGLGRDPADLINDFYDDMERSRKADEDNYRDPQLALATLRVEVEDWNAMDPELTLPLPVRILEVLEVEVKCGMRSDGLRLKVRAIRVDENNNDIEDVLTFWSARSYGSRMDPPDYESDLQWESYKP